MDQETQAVVTQKVMKALEIDKVRTYFEKAWDAQVVDEYISGNSRSCPLAYYLDSVFDFDLYIRVEARYIEVEGVFSEDDDDNTFSIQPPPWVIEFVSVLDRTYGALDEEEDSAVNPNEALAVLNQVSERMSSDTPSSPAT